MTPLEMWYGVVMGVQLSGSERAMWAERANEWVGGKMGNNQAPGSYITHKQH